MLTAYQIGRLVYESEVGHADVSSLSRITPDSVPLDVHFQLREGYQQQLELNNDCADLEAGELELVP
jgi:hypothetical protein